MYTSIYALLMSFSVITGVIEAPPEDFLSLGETEKVFTMLQIEHDEESLIKLIGGAPKAVFNAKKLIDAVTLLREGNSKERREAKKILNSAGPKALNFFKKLVNDPDPEVSETAKSIINKSKASERQARESGMTPEVVKLLAIRRLTQLKSQKALDAIKTLTSHKDSDVAREAKRAVSLLAGAKPQRAKRGDASESALKMLPESSGFAAVLDLTEPSKAMTLKGYLAEMLKMKIPGMDTDMVVNQFHRFFPSVMTMVGNPQVDSVMLALADNIGVDRKSGWAGFIFTGKYNLEKMKNTLKMNFDIKEEDGHSYFSDKWGPSFYPVNESTLIMAFGPGRDGHMAPFIKALKNDKVPSKFVSLADTKTHRLKAMGAFSKGQLKMMREEFTRELERVQGRDRMEAEVQKAMLKLGMVFIESENLEAFYSKKVVTLSGTLKDAEKLKKFETLLKDADAKLRKMIASAPIPMIGQIFDTEKALTKATISGEKFTVQVKADFLNLVGVMPFLFASKVRAAEVRAVEHRHAIEVQAEAIEDVQLEEPAPIEEAPARKVKRVRKIELPEPVEK